MKVTHVRITRAESERSEIIVAFVAVFVFLTGPAMVAVENKRSPAKIENEIRFII